MGYHVSSFVVSEAVANILDKLPWGKRSDFINACILKINDPKSSSSIANPDDLPKPIHPGLLAKSEKSDSEETKSEPPAITLSAPSTTKSTTPATQNILRKLTSSAQS